MTTQPPISDRERNTVEALQRVKSWHYDYSIPIDLADQINAALDAYKPKPQRVPVLPDHEQLCAIVRDIITTTLSGDWTPAMGKLYRGEDFNAKGPEVS